MSASAVCPFAQFDSGGAPTTRNARRSKRLPSGVAVRSTAATGKARVGMMRILHAKKGSNESLWGLDSARRRFLPRARGWQRQRAKIADWSQPSIRVQDL